MILSCIGHAKFLVELESGLRILTDPYDPSCGYPVTPVAADVVLVSHGHHDHAAVETVPGEPRIIKEAGKYTLSPDVKVTAIEACHDDKGGAQRGKNLLFLIEAEGLRVAHLGDLGHLPTEEQVKALAPLDAVMIPVGGFFTIDAPTAKQVAEMLQARIVLPMHYRSAATEGWPIGTLDQFTSLYAEKAEELDLLRLTAGDMACQPHLAVLKPQSLRD
ncbi:MAG: MBL fold metallo-hydrolase [Christensenellaceae bacterium]|nr:MBL fold metallo-hydrolase [Christensenellaceae bacterium]